MSDHNTNTAHTHHTRETHVEKRGGGSGLAFIVGGLVVAVGILAFLFWGGDAPDGAGSAGGGDVSISVEGGEGGEAAAEGSASDGTGGESAGASAESGGGADASAGAAATDGGAAADAEAN